MAVLVAVASEFVAFRDEPIQNLGPAQRLPTQGKESGLYLMTPQEFQEFRSQGLSGAVIIGEHERFGAPTAECQ